MRNVEIFVKFDETLDISINLNIDASKTEQNIKGVTNLPNGTGKKVRVAVITSDDNVTEAKESGADLYGGQEFIDNISSNKIDFDILIDRLTRTQRRDVRCTHDAFLFWPLTT